VAKSDRGWYPGQADFDWIEWVARAPHAVLLEMEAQAAPEGIPILSRDSGRMLAILAGGGRSRSGPRSGIRRYGPRSGRLTTARS
jgi:hypothetical protein